MELTDYIHILRKRWWIVIVAVVLTAGSALDFGTLQHPEYTSTAEVIILPARPDLGLAQSTKMFLRTYMTTVDSYKWAQKVIERLQLPMTPEKLKNRAHFAAEDDRMVIKLEIEAYDGDLADDIAQTWANLLIQWRDEKNAQQRKEDRVYAELRDYPTYSQSWPPSKGVLLVTGGVFGLVIAGVVIFFLEWLEASAARIRQGLSIQLDLTGMDAVLVLCRRWWVIVAAVVLTAGGTLALGELQHSRYTSTAEIIIEPERPEWGLAQSAKMLLRTYMTVIESRKTAEKVVDTLALSMSPDQLFANARFAAEGDRMVIKIEIEDRDGDQANRIAAEWAQQLIDWRKEKNAALRREDHVYAELRDYPSYNQSWPPSKRTRLAAGGVFGLVIASVVIFFLEWSKVGTTHAS
jgi:capsular polysaccharide biosynthesis protein